MRLCMRPDVLESKMLAARNSDTWSNRFSLVKKSLEHFDTWGQFSTPPFFCIQKQFSPCGEPCELACKVNLVMRLGMEIAHSGSNSP